MSRIAVGALSFLSLMWSFLFMAHLLLSGKGRYEQGLLLTAAVVFSGSLIACAILAAAGPRARDYRRGSEYARIAESRSHEPEGDPP